MTKTSPFPDLDELRPMIIGFLLGIALILFFVVLCLVVGLSPAVEFGVPLQ